MTGWRHWCDKHQVPFIVARICHHGGRAAPLMRCAACVGEARDRVRPLLADPVAECHAPPLPPWRHVCAVHDCGFVVAQSYPGGGLVMRCPRCVEAAHERFVALIAIRSLGRPAGRQVTTPAVFMPD